MRLNLCFQPHVWHILHVFWDDLCHRHLETKPSQKWCFCARSRCSPWNPFHKSSGHLVISPKKKKNQTKIGAARFCSVFWNTFCGLEKNTLDCWTLAKPTFHAQKGSLKRRLWTSSLQRVVAMPCANSTWNSARPQRVFSSKVGQKMGEMMHWWRHSETEFRRCLHSFAVGKS